MSNHLESNFSKNSTNFVISQLMSGPLTWNIDHTLLTKVSKINSKFYWVLRKNESYSKWEYSLKNYVLNNNLNLTTPHTPYITQTQWPPIYGTICMGLVSSHITNKVRLKKSNISNCHLRQTASLKKISGWFFFWYTRFFVIWFMS